MKQNTLYGVIFILLSVTQFATSNAQTTDIKQIEAKIKELEGSQTELGSIVDMWRDLQTQLKNDELVMYPFMFGSFPIPKKNFKNFIATMLLTDRMDPKRVPSIIQRTTDLTKVFAKEVDKELQLAEKALRKNKDDLSYFLNERIRLREISSPGSVEWNGTYSDGSSAIIISTSGTSFSATSKYSLGFVSMNGKIEGNKVTGSWTATHEDDTKKGSRSGTFTATLNGNTLTGQFVEDTPVWSYKPGYSAANVQSAMYKGKIWPINHKKQ